jgi:hypothetical protein
MAASGPCELAVLSMVVPDQAAWFGSISAAIPLEHLYEFRQSVKHRRAPPPSHGAENRFRY